MLQMIYCCLFFMQPIFALLNNSSFSPSAVCFLLSKTKWNVEVSFVQHNRLHKQMLLCCNAKTLRSMMKLIWIFKMWFQNDNQRGYKEMTLKQDSQWWTWPSIVDEIVNILLEKLFSLKAKGFIALFTAKMVAELE